MSYADRRVLACALANKYKITTGDGDLIQFGEQEFSGTFKDNITPLEIINSWLKKGLIEWDDTKHEYLAEWDTLNEHKQPKKAMGVFQRLTKRFYRGS